MKTGLQLTPRTREDARVINEAIAILIFTLNIILNLGFYFFLRRRKLMMN